MFLDDYLKINKNVYIDYIHEKDTVVELSKENNIGIILESINKEDFFKTVSKNGTFPKKAFSIGNSSDKRYYLEARKIK